MRPTGVPVSVGSEALLNGSAKTGASARTWYRASVGEVAVRPALRDSVRADVAIVGGGFTGVATALELAERGIDVVLLEAGRIGDGATGRNGGQVTGSLSGLGAMRRQLRGRPGADAFLRHLRWDAQDLIRERVCRYGIDCELTSGHLHTAWSPRHRDGLRRDVDDARAAGIDDVRWLERDEVHARLATPLYHGGVLNRHNLHLNSLKLCLGEAAAAESLGARLHEYSEAVRIEPGEGRREPAVVTPGGRVRAARVLLAGNAYHRLHARRFRGLLLPAVLGNLVTEPLGEATLDAIDPERLAVYDSRTVLDYYRPTGDGRLMFGGGTNYSGADLPDVAATLRPSLERTFPRLRGVRIDYAWTGRAGIVPNRIPLVGELPGGTLYAQGYSGHGIATSHLVARALAAHIDGESMSFQMLASFVHRRLIVGSWGLAAGMALAAGSDHARSLIDKAFPAR